MVALEAFLFRFVKARQSIGKILCFRQKYDLCRQRNTLKKTYHPNSFRSCYDHPLSRSHGHSRFYSDWNNRNLAVSALHCNRLTGSIAGVSRLSHFTLRLQHRRALFHLLDNIIDHIFIICLLYTSPSPRDRG